MFLRVPYTKMASGRQISPTTFIIFITLFVFSTFTLVSSYYRGLQRQQSDLPWDVLIFTQNWPASVCQKWMHEGKSNRCFNYPNNTWTIHGLWPTKFGTIGPGFCNNDSSFSPEAIYGLKDQLLQWWPPVEMHKKQNAFWAHEWKKHGTCAALIPELSTEFDYFYKGLQLIKQYNMNDVLGRAGITPGQSYNVTRIWDGVARVLNKRPQVVCFEEKGGISILLEIRICLDKGLKLCDCDGTVVGGRGRNGYQNLTNCAIEKPVQYISGPPTRVFLKEEQQKLDTKKIPLIEKFKLLRFSEWFTG